MDEAFARAADARAVLIAGPTASGKSALALHLAQSVAAAGRPATIVNADSMQVYDALTILTARPRAADLASAPHCLYGHAPAANRYSVGAWLDEVAPILDRCSADGDLPILVGGTGLYLKALLDGIAIVPAIPAAVRAEVEARLAAEGPDALHRELVHRDRHGASTLRRGDVQRVQRALEVVLATGEPLWVWQRRSAPPLLGAEGTVRLVVGAPAEVLRSRIDARFDAMVEQGVADEVRALLALQLAPSLPAMKAIGVREIAASLQGATGLVEAIDRAKVATRQYAKRQRTWLRNQFADWGRISADPKRP